MSDEKRTLIDLTDTEKVKVENLLPTGWHFDSVAIFSYDAQVWLYLKDLQPLFDYLTSINVDPYA